jgi:hypothetical protein
MRLGILRLRLVLALGAQEPILAQDDSLTSEKSFDDWRFGVGGFFFVGVDFAVILSVERPVLGVELLGRHRQDEAVFLALEAGGVVAAVGIDHALGEGAGVHEFGERSGEVVVLLVELVLGPDHDPHVGEGRGFGIRARGVAAKLRLIGCSRSLGHGGRRGGGWRFLCEQSRSGDAEGRSCGKKTKGNFSHAESLLPSGVENYPTNLRCGAVSRGSFSCYSRNLTSVTSLCSGAKCRYALAKQLHP